MKRHPTLLQFSREHYSALKLARDARRSAESGEASGITALAQHVTGLFATEIDSHFRVEEQGILALLAQSGEHALVARTLAEHAELRRLAKELATPGAQTLLDFADLLTAHVRFEEREVFEAAQARFPVDADAISDASSPLVGN